METLKRYYNLIKPGIVISNSMAVIAGVLLATAGVGEWHLGAFLSVVIGTALVIASACVVNNLMDRGIDKRMARTKKRELVTGTISTPGAIIYAIVLGLLGFGLLFLGTNLLTFILGVIAYIWYVVIYGWAKRTSSWSTLIGSVAGALPPVAGYTAITNQLDLGALCVFIILAMWQMGHFYSIAIYRRADYAAAKIPLLTVTRGVPAAKKQIVFYIILFIAATLCLGVAGYIGIIAMVVLAVTGFWWLRQSIRLLRAKTEADDIKGARKLFGFSLLVLMVTCACLAAGGYLP